MTLHTSSNAALRASDDLANVWTRRGIALLNEGNSVSLQNAIGCFDKAIAIRAALPLDANPWLRYGLAAGWLNRADALVKIGSAENLVEALRSFDEAIVQLRALRLDESPRFRQRMAVAWLNRGIAFQVQGTESMLSEAVRSFDECIATLNVGNADQVTDRPTLLACAWMNRGNALLSFATPQPDAARMAACESLRAVTRVEATDLVAAEAGLKARHVLCRATASLLTQESTQPRVAENLITEATDAVEDGIKLARDWEARGETRFRSLTVELFHFGARVYQAYQPHFLAEFLLENLSPIPSPDAQTHKHELCMTATDALQRALAAVQHESFKALHTPRFFQWIERVREIREVHERLAQVRRSEQFCCIAPN